MLLSLQRSHFVTENNFCVDTPKITTLHVVIELEENKNILDTADGRRM